MKIKKGILAIVFASAALTSCFEEPEWLKHDGAATEERAKEAFAAAGYFAHKEVSHAFPYHTYNLTDKATGKACKGTYYEATDDPTSGKITRISGGKFIGP